MAVGDFSIINDFMREILQHDYNEINKIPGAWVALKNHNPDHSFMFHTNGGVWTIIQSRLSDSHSGASAGYSLRNMEYIAKHGWEQYVNIKNK
jgi:hypothetical protein